MAGLCFAVTAVAAALTAVEYALHLGGGGLGHEALDDLIECSWK